MTDLDKFSIECNYTDVNTPASGPDLSSKRERKEAEKTNTGLLIFLIACVCFSVVIIFASFGYYYTINGGFKYEDISKFFVALIVIIMLIFILVYLVEQLNQ